MVGWWDGQIADCAAGGDERAEDEGDFRLRALEERGGGGLQGWRGKVPLGWSYIRWG